MRTLAAVALELVRGCRVQAESELVIGGHAATHLYALACCWSIYRKLERGGDQGLWAERRSLAHLVGRVARPLAPLLPFAPLARRLFGGEDNDHVFHFSPPVRRHRGTLRRTRASRPLHHFSLPPPARHRFHDVGCSVSKSRVANSDACMCRLVSLRGARPVSLAAPSPKSAVAAKPAACSSRARMMMPACPRPPRRIWPTISSSLRSSSP